MKEEYEARATRQASMGAFRPKPANLQDDRAACDRSRQGSTWRAGITIADDRERVEVAIVGWKEIFLDAQQQSIPNLQESSTKRPCLIVILRAQLTLAKDVRWPLKGFVVGSKRYHDAAFGNWTGFYDWLRDARGSLLGVRYTPFNETEFLTERTKGLAYVKSDPPRHLEIYFSDRREFDDTRSCDQEFLYDAVFRSDDGEYAIGFGMEELSESDLRGLEETGAEWAVARPLE